MAHAHLTMGDIFGWRSEGRSKVAFLAQMTDGCLHVLSQGAHVARQHRPKLLVACILMNF